MSAGIADVIAFPASEDARFVTGVNRPVDGGLTASNGEPAHDGVRSCTQRIDSGRGGGGSVAPGPSERCTMTLSAQRP